jgi:hypothetical protein
MLTPNKERQRKWKAIQASEGRKPVTVMLSAEVKDLIDKERERTGGTIAGIIEKAVINLLNPSPVDSIFDKADLIGDDKLDFIISHPDGRKIFKAVGLYYNTGANAERIADSLNSGTLKTFSGNDEWTVEEVKEILDVVENDRLLYFKIVDGTE